MSSDSNDQTILAYEENFQAYIDATPKDVSGDVKKWLDKTIEYIAKDAVILELGSAFGRDASYLENLGYKVQCSDATNNFVKVLTDNGHNAVHLNVITDELGGPYDLILANCVFLHFTPDEFEKVLIKIMKSLKPGGILAFSVKRGDGMGWSSMKVNAPRFFQYWTGDKLRELLVDHSYNIKDIRDGEANELDKVYVIAEKPINPLDS